MSQIPVMRGHGGGGARPVWGEVPKAFVTLKREATLTEAELIAHVRQRIATFKAPKYVEFGEIPKTSTGKSQKSGLRERERRKRA